MEHSRNHLKQLELRIPPLALLVVAALAAAFLAWAFPENWDIGPGGYIFGTLVANAGATISWLGVLSFQKRGTTVNPLRPQDATDLVVDGIYRRTRNPMYLGFVLILIGIAIALGSALAFALVPMFIAYLHRFQILPEEKALLQKFGTQAVSYLTAVPRWL